MSDENLFSKFCTAGISFFTGLKKANDWYMNRLKPAAPKKIPNLEAEIMTDQGADSSAYTGPVRSSGPVNTASTADSACSACSAVTVSTGLTTDTTLIAHRGDKHDGLGNGCGVGAD